MTKGGPCWSIFWINWNNLYVVFDSGLVFAGCRTVLGELVHFIDIAQIGTVDGSFHPFDIWSCGCFLSSCWWLTLCVLCLSWSVTWLFSGLVLVISSWILIEVWLLQLRLLSWLISLAILVDLSLWLWLPLLLQLLKLLHEKIWRKATRCLSICLLIGVSCGLVLLSFSLLLLLRQLHLVLTHSCGILLCAILLHLHLHLLLLSKLLELLLLLLWLLNLLCLLLLLSWHNIALHRESLLSLQLSHVLSALQLLSLLLRLCPWQS